MINASSSETCCVSSRPRHEIYISSIGKLLGKDLSCHVKKDEKELFFEKKTPTLPKLVMKLFSNIQKDAFHEIVKSTATKRNYSNKIFLPSAFLTNDIEAMKSYKQKLATTQVDKYISLNIPIKRAQSARLDKSYANETATQKDVDSTCLENRQKSSYYSKSIDNTKIGSKLKVSDIRVIEYDASTSRSRASRSHTKRDIIHITYTQTILGLAKTPQTKRINRDERRSSTIKVKQFRTDDLCSITDRKQEQTTNHRYESMVSGESRSPDIGKNRGKGMKVANFFTGKEFLNIDLDC